MTSLPVPLVVEKESGNVEYLDGKTRSGDREKEGLSNGEHESMDTCQNCIEEMKDSGKPGDNFGMPPQGGEAFSNRENGLQGNERQGIRAYWRREEYASQRESRVGDEDGARTANQPQGLNKEKSQIPVGSQMGSSVREKEDGMSTANLENPQFLVDSQMGSVDGEEEDRASLANQSQDLYRESSHFLVSQREPGDREADGIGVGEATPDSDKIESSDERMSIEGVDGCTGDETSKLIVLNSVGESQEQDFGRERRATITNVTEGDFMDIESLDSQGIMEHDEEPKYPPGFEPQQSFMPMIGEGYPLGFEPQQQPMTDRSSHHTKDKDTQTENENRRLTRRAVRKLASKEKEAFDVWALGKKLGLYSKNEDAVLKELSKDGSPCLATSLRKRGQPRKTKP